MTFDELLLSVQKYVRMQSTETKDSIRTSIKESVEDFVRMHDWKLIQEAVPLSFGDETSYDLEVLLAGTWTITAADIALKTFTVAGNVSPLFTEDLTFTVAGSTGNNGTYTISSSAYSAGSTVITVDEAVPSAVAGGTITMTDTIVPFTQEVELIKSTGAKWYKYDYPMYLQLTSKSDSWSVHGTKIYVSGGGTMTFLYSSKGNELTLGTDEPKVLKYYWDVIFRMSVVNFLTSIGDLEPMQLERATLQSKLQSLRAGENRVQKQGELHHVGR